MSNLDREVKTDLRDVLSIVACSEDYGHANQIFWDFCAGLVKHVSFEDIEEYAKELSSQHGYGEEDYEKVKKVLTDWVEDMFEGR